MVNVESWEIGTTGSAADSGGQEPGGIKRPAGGRSRRGRDDGPRKQRERGDPQELPQGEKISSADKGRK